MQNSFSAKPLASTEVYRILFDPAFGAWNWKIIRPAALIEGSGLPSLAVWAAGRIKAGDSPNSEIRIERRQGVNAWSETRVTLAEVAANSPRIQAIDQYFE